MAEQSEQERAAGLAKQAVQLVVAGKAEDGSRAIRQAVSLAPDNRDVKEAFAKIQLNDSVQPLLKLCKKFVEDNDAAAGKEALAYLRGSGATVFAPAAENCLQLVIDATKTKESDVRDDLAAAILHNCLPARAYLAKKLQASVKRVFDQIFEIGDRSSSTLSALMLDVAAWNSDASRKKYEKDVFQLFVAKLLESGHDYDGRALRGIARLLAVNANELCTFVDEESFEAILVSLDNRLPPEVRSQATLATAKFLEFSSEKGHEYLSRFVNTKMVHGTNEDLIKAFSVAAAVFPLVPTVAAGLFLTDGFLPSLVPPLDRKARNPKVEKAALDMLNAACIDRGCREAIAKYCTEWMNHVMESSKEDRHGQAAVILAKVRGTSKSENSSLEDGPQNLISTLKEMLLHGGEMDRLNSVEGLAYASMQANVKEAIVNDKALLGCLFEVPPRYFMTSSAVFGSLTLIDNLARYLPNLSEEQKRVSQLKAYANASKDGTKVDPLNDDSRVVTRCKALIDAGVLPYLVNLKNNTTAKALSSASLGLVANILLSLSKVSESRGKIAQQGTVPLLLLVYKDPSTEIQFRTTAAHAIARILISVDPKLLSNHATSLISPLLTLLNEEDSEGADGPRDLLPLFEGLLALTNLVSDPTLNAGPGVMRSSFPRIEDLLLSHNKLVQRATTELVCNLMTCHDGIERFADGSKTAGRRLHILLALADVDDIATRRAAGGALATITQFDAAVLAILDRKRGVEILLALCQDDDPGCMHRGVVCIRNMLFADGDTAKKACEKLKALDCIEVLKGVLKSSRDSAVLEVGVKALKVLLA